MLTFIRLDNKQSYILFRLSLSRRDNCFTLYSLISSTKSKQNKTKNGTSSLMVNISIALYRNIISCVNVEVILVYFYVRKVFVRVTVYRLLICFILTIYPLLYHHNQQIILILMYYYEPTT